jgi:hypothetical protein
VDTVYIDALGRDASEATVDSFWDEVDHRLRGRCLYLTKRSIMGHASSNVRNKDILVKLDRANLHMLLRKSSYSSFEYVSETYMHGLVLGDNEPENLIQEEFTLV